MRSSDSPWSSQATMANGLQRDGWNVNHKRVLRVMRQEALLCQLDRRFVRTTDSAHALRTYPNLLARTEWAGSDQAWVPDLTYIRLPTAFAYLACIFDAWSWRCVGWQLLPGIDADLTLAVLDHAFVMRRPGPGMIHHSDRGCSTPAAPTSRGWRRGQPQHGHRRQPVRERQGRELPQDAHTGGGLPQPRPNVSRSRDQPESVLPWRLQGQAFALKPRRPAASRVRGAPLGNEWELTLPAVHNQVFALLAAGQGRGRVLKRRGHLRRNSGCFGSVPPPSLTRRTPSSPVSGPSRYAPVTPASPLPLPTWISRRSTPPRRCSDWTSTTSPGVIRVGQRGLPSRVRIDTVTA